MHFPETNPVFTWCRFFSAKAIRLKKWLVTPHKAIKNWDAFRLERVLNNHVVVYRENLNRILA